ncbi:MAG TPA: hypothetical protein VGF99_11750 [Myxococcota bacterium]
MPKPDDADDAAARLPQRATPGATTRTDARALPSPPAPTREHTSVTRPLFTADDSAEDDSADSGEDDATDFDALATVAEVQALPAIDAATRISSGRQPDRLVRNDVDSAIDGDSDDADAIDEHAVTRAVDTAAMARVARDDRDDDDEDDDDDDPALPDERTMVSVVVPEHLRDGGPTAERSLEGRGERTVDAGDDEVSALLASAPPSIHGRQDDLEPRSTELMPRTASRIVEAPVPAKPGWLTGAVVFGAIVVVVIIVLAIAFAAR